MSVDDVREIRRVHATWIDVERADRPADLASLMDPRITLLPPGSDPVAGRDAVLEWMRENAAEITSLRVADPMIDVQGDLATLVAGFRTMVRSGQGLERITGQHAWLLWRAADRWAVVAVTWSVNDEATWRDARAACGRRFVRMTLRCRIAAHRHGFRAGPRRCSAVYRDERAAAGGVSRIAGSGGKETARFRPERSGYAPAPARVSGWVELDNCSRAPRTTP